MNKYIERAAEIFNDLADGDQAIDYTELDAMLWFAAQRGELPACFEPVIREHEQYANEARVPEDEPEGFAELALWRLARPHLHIYDNREVEACFDSQAICRAMARLLTYHMRQDREHEQPSSIADDRTEISHSDYFEPYMSATWITKHFRIDASTITKAKAEIRYRSTPSGRVFSLPACFRRWPDRFAGWKEVYNGHIQENTRIQKKA